jgi:very-short-patch-repair endonuclease
MWGLLAAPPAMPEVSVPHTRSPRLAGVRVYRSTDLVASNRVVRRGIRVTDPARTLLDLSGVVSARTTDLAIDRAIAAKITTVPRLVATLERDGRRGRRGSGTLRRALDARGVSAPDRTPTALESAMARLKRIAGIAAPVAEYTVANGRYRFDFAWPEIRVAAEVDGWIGHSAFDDWRRNLEKGNWATAHDWLVLHFDWDAVTRRPEKTAAELRHVIASRALTPEL